MSSMSLRFRLFLCLFAFLCFFGPLSISAFAQSALMIATTSVPNGTQGVAYSQQLYATGGTAPYTWSYGVGGPPSGISLSSSGLLSGTPTGNTYPFSTTINVIVKDSLGNQAAENLPITINPAGNQALAITTTSVPNGTQGGAYSQQLYVTGGTSPYTWSIGAQGPPSGISLSSSGLLSGTPTGNVYPYQAEINIIVTDSASHQATEILPLLINPASSTTLTITTTSVPNGTQGVAYSQQLSATGGTAPYTWSVGAQGPPSGMSLSSSGLLSGTPSGNTYPYQAEINVIVTDSASHQATEVLPLTINAAGSQPTLIRSRRRRCRTGLRGWRIRSSCIPASFIGVANYSTNQNVYAGDLAQFNTTWWLGGSQLGDEPNQLQMIQAGDHYLPTFNTGNVGVSQNFFTAGGAGACVTTSAGCTPNTSHMTQTIQLAYNELGPGAYYSIGNEEDNNSSDDVAPAVYVPQFQAWVNVIKGIDPTAKIVGPNIEQWSCCTSTSTNPWGTAGTWFHAFVTAYQQAYGVKPPIDVLSMHLYNTNLATGSDSDDFTTTEDTNMVNDVQNYRNYANSVGFTGTPIWITEFGFVHKNVVGPQTVEQNAQAARVVEDLADASTSLGLQHVFWFTANGSIPVDDGLDPLYSPTATSSPSSPMPLTDIGQLASNLTHNQVPLIATTSLPSANTGMAYSQQLVALGATAPFTWTGQGLPGGISLSSSGLLLGTPTSSSSTTINIFATDNAGSTASESLQLPINVLTITTTSVPNATQGVAYSQQLSVTGGTAPYTWSYLLDPPNNLPGGVGPLPNGMSLSSTGLLSGTPSGNTLYPDAAEFWIDVVVTDNVGNKATEILPLLLDASGIPQFAVTTASLPAATVGQAYSQQLSATGGYIEISHAYTWSYGGNLPAGLTLSASGLLSGTPANAGQQSIHIIAYDDVTNQASKVFTLTINPATSQSLAITTASLPNATQGVAYSQTLNATGGTGAYTWTGSGLPGGMSLSSDGVLFGTPSGDAYPETANIGVTVTDSGSQQVSKTLTLTINAMGSGQTAIPASFIAVANYGIFNSANPQNVYGGDLDQFNTKWWLGGSQVETTDQNQTNMLAAGYHFLPIFNTGHVALEQGLFVANPSDPNSCISTACASYTDGALGTPTQSQPCGPENTSVNGMRYTACLAAHQVGPGGYYGIGNEEDAGGSDDVAPDVYVAQFSKWVSLIKQYDPTAHIVGPNMTSWNCCGGGVSYNYPWGPGGQWFNEFVAAYKAANGGALPPIDVLSMHLYNFDTSAVADTVSNTEADNFVNEVTAFRNAANTAGYTTAGTPIWITEMGFDYDVPGQTLFSPQYGQTGSHTSDQNTQITRVINGLSTAGPSLNLQRIFLFTDGNSYDVSIGLEPLYNPSSPSSPSTPMSLTDYGTLVHNLAFQP